MNRKSARLLAGVALVAMGAAAAIAVEEYRGPFFKRTTAAQAPAEPAKPGRRILYYKNPMGHPDTSPVPKKDEMGMAYIPVYEGDDDDSGAVKVSADRLQKLGIRSEPAAMRDLRRTIRAPGTVHFHEGRQVLVTARFDGWIEKLSVAHTGDKVRRGQALATFYSFDLYRVQVEHFGRGTRTTAANQELGPLVRLRNLGIAEEDIQGIVRAGRASLTLPLRSPIDGVVVEKKAIEGMRAAPGDMLYRIVDLSTVWIIADIYEQDLADVTLGSDVEASFVAYPGRRFTGKVTFLYPTVTMATRTARVRIEVPNADGALLADMFARVEIAPNARSAPVLAVPDSAIIDSGTRRVVFVEKGEGRFEPREIKTGRRGDGYVAVTEGLREGEKVVVSGNFLIDAESNLKAAIRALMKEERPGGEKKP